MKGLVYEGIGSVRVKDVPDPALRAGEVMVRPLVTAVCLTDVASYDGWYPIPASEPNSYPAELPGIIIGHESCAEIIEVGKEVKGWSVGDRVAIEPTVFCQHCEMCTTGLYEFCTTYDAPKQALGINSRDAEGKPLYNGLFAEYAAVPQEMLFGVPDKVSSTAAASIEILSIGYTRLRAARMGIGDNVVVFGAAYDYLVMAQLAALAATDVIVIDPFPNRRAVARLHFEHAIDPGAVDVVDYVQSVMPGGADIVMSGIDTIDMAVACCRTNGMLSLAPVGSWQPRRADPVLLAQQKTSTSYLPRTIQLAPSTPIHCHERWKGGQIRHCYDIVARMLAQGRLDVESSYETLPWDRFGEMETAFDDYHARHFRVAVDIGGK